MQLVLTIISAPDESGQLGATLVVPAGGASIGRGTNNTVVLPDASRITSSTHATITEQQPGSFTLVDHSSNGTFLNNADTALEKGMEVPLQGGEVLTIGPYQLQVALQDVAPEPNLGGSYLDSLNDSANSGDVNQSRVEPSLGTNPPGDDIDKWLLTGVSQQISQPPGPSHNGREPAFQPSPPVSTPSPIAGNQAAVDPLELLGQSSPIANSPAEPLLGDSGSDDSQWWQEPQADHAPPMQHAMTPPRVLDAGQGAEQDGEMAPMVGQPVNNQANAIAAQLGLKGLSPDQLEQLPPQVAEALLQSLARIMDILRARSMIKNEIRAAHTVIGAIENNPLKFAAQLQDAVNYLFAEDTPGFMPVDRAINESFNDIEDHQFAMLAGMRAAYESMLGYFDPSSLVEETGIGPAGAKLSGGKKAKAWDAFQKHYDRLRQDQEAAYLRLFGETFSKNYQEQIERLQQGRRKDKT